MARQALEFGFTSKAGADDANNVSVVVLWAGWFARAIDQRRRARALSRLKC